MSVEAPKKKKLKIRLILIILMSLVSGKVSAGQTTALGSSTYEVFENRLLEAKKCIDCAHADDNNWTSQEMAVGDIIEDLSSEIGTCSTTVLATYSADLETALSAYRLTTPSGS